MSIREFNDEYAIMLNKSPFLGEKDEIRLNCLLKVKRKCHPIDAKFIE